MKYDPPIINEFDFTSSAIGVGAITITTDGFVILIRRALWTGEAAGKIDRPGGHPEPDEALKVYLKIFHNVSQLNLNLYVSLFKKS